MTALTAFVKAQILTKIISKEKDNIYGVLACFPQMLPFILASLTYWLSEHWQLEQKSCVHITLNNPKAY